MNSTSSPDLLSFTRFQTTVGGVKERLETTAQEVASGRYKDLTKQTNGDIGKAHILRKSINDAQAYQTGLQIASSRAERTQTALEVLNNYSSSIGIEAKGAIATSDLDTLRVISREAEAALDAVFGALNTTDGGRALFGGDVTNQTPLSPASEMLDDLKAIVAGATDLADARAQIDTYFDDPAGGFETDIYRGGDGEVAGTELLPGSRVNISAKANDPEFKALIRGLAEVAVYESAVNFDGVALADDGAGHTLNAELGVTEVRAQIGISQNRIENAIARYASEESVLTSLYNDVASRDPYEAASELQLLQTQLESSYLITARLAELSISNYIR